MTDGDQLRRKKALVTGPVRSLSHAYRRRRFAILFFTLLLTLAGEPLLRTAGVEADVLQAFLGLNALAAVLGAFAGRARQVLLALLVFFIGSRIVGVSMQAPFLLPVSQGVWAFIVLLALGGTLRSVLRRGAVDSERIYAALSAYLLAGLAFGVVYWTYGQVWPGSFQATSGRDELSFWRATYFSFVTLASLGYGDIVPVSDAARGLAVLEVVSGQMYLAVLVARLVSLYASQERAGPSCD